MTGFYSVTFFAVLFGNFDALGVYASQIRVKGDPKRLNQLLRQSIAISTSILIIITIPLSFVVPITLEAVSADAGTID